MKSGKLNTAALWLALVAMAFLNWGPSFGARNGSGAYSVPNSFTAGSTITASDFNENFTDIANEITNSVAADGQTSMTGPLKGYSGSVSAPGYTFSADTNSGMYRIGADNIGLAVGGTKIIDVSSTGVDITGTVTANGLALFPSGMVVNYAGSSAPTGWLLAYGQAVDRTTYASLFTAISTTYGTGDGSTTFNLPDCRGRVIAGKDDMGGSAASRLTSTYFGTSAAALGAVGGSQSHTLTEAQLPNLTKTVAITDPGHTHPGLQENGVNINFSADNVIGSGSSTGIYQTGGNEITVRSNTTGITASVTFGSGNAHNIVQPTIIMNCIIKY